MKTEVVMQRELFGMPISQKSKSEFFSATDLVKAGNKWRYEHGMSIFNFSMWLQSKSTKEFVTELEQEYGKVIIKGKSKKSQTWVHPFLFIDLALSISPRLKIEAYKWLYDQLLKNRNNSGDSYKQMCGNLYVRHGDKSTFPKFISNVASQIKIKCNVEDWQKATEDQLFQRNVLHNKIALLANVLNNNNEAVRLGLIH